ncbi:hypothetical protein [Corynebacterium sp.]|nr:hypothetical protein [Corynebacterium sp.]
MLHPYVAEIIPIYTPSGDVADPYHPAYAAVWLLAYLLGLTI